MSFIEFKNVKKRFDKNIIYENLTLNVNKNENLTLIGGSGTGKSVMLKLLIGLLKTDEGNILFDNKEITNYTEYQFIGVRKRIAMLFQNGALFDSLNVADNIVYPLKMHFKMPKREMMDIVKQNLEFVGLPGIEKKMPSELSGGMKKRVGLARALATSPEVILYDEPTTGLDPINVTLINKLIRYLQEKLNVTSIIVTHDMQSAFYVSDRIAMLWEKRIIFEGSVKEVQNTDNKKVHNFVNGLQTEV